MRWWREFWKPSLKCERLGCAMKTTRVRIRRPGEGYRTVATDYIALVDTCPRCGTSTEPWGDVFEGSFTSCSMPSDMDREMRRKGYIILETLGPVGGKSDESPLKVVHSSKICAYCTDDATDCHKCEPVGIHFRGRKLYTKSSPTMEAESA